MTTRVISHLPDSSPSDRSLRLSAVSFFNTAPLVWGLDQDSQLRLKFGVPSSLLDDLVNGSADVALLPVIDYQRADGLRIIPATGIGCDGETLTVRLFSRRPIEQTRLLAVDPDSHTSVALARIILKHQFGVWPELIPLTRASQDVHEARLLIGDKVVTHEPQGFEYQVDLGAAWKKLTGMGFVFAVWTARQGVEVGDLDIRLRRALDEGLLHVDEVVEKDAVKRGWPPQIARKYLLDYLKFRIGPDQLRAIGHFHRMAYDLGLIERCQPLRFATEVAD